MKTIKMPKESLNKWLTALRSGKYEQCAGYLEYDGAYCCLGVLQHALTGHTVVGDNNDELPSLEWLAEHDIVFLGRRGAEDNSPWLGTLDATADDANDDRYENSSAPDGVRHRYDFNAIADAIEAAAEGV